VQTFLANEFLSSEVAGVIHYSACFLMNTMSWAAAIRPKLIYVFSACTRVIYSPVGFGQRLLAWLPIEPTCTNTFRTNWSRLS